MVLAAVVALPRSSTASSNGESTEPLFDGLGTHHRRVSTTSDQAQRYWDQGLAFLFAFNHDEAIRSFQQAAVIDPHCAMTWWGIAIANGPHINKAEVAKANADAAWQAIKKARENLSTASTLEKELIEAASARYVEVQPESRKALDLAYANAMRRLWQAHADDADIGALFAESMMDLRPWDFWTQEGKPQPGTEEIIKTLESVLEKAPQHPLALHLYIHSLEASPHPDKADAVGDRLRHLEPGLGHMVHMPSHLDVRRGRWAQAVQANLEAIAADRQYSAKSPKQGFYRLYMAHNHAMLTYAAMMRGQSKLAIDTITAMIHSVPADWAKSNAALADMVAPMPLEVLMRFGRWDDVLAAAEPPEFLPVARSMRHAARGVALAARGEVDKARAEQDAFTQARAKVAAEAKVGNNKAKDVLNVAERLLQGEVLYRSGKVEEGLAALRQAVILEDKLRYDEPPDWLHPVRHALGATLLREGRAQEAEQVYRADLDKLSNNGWSLYGMAKALRLQGKEQDAQSFDALFREAWKEADVKITSSCFCQPAQ
jgi:tetratricopeptide (TPR) repeat protein